MAKLKITLKKSLIGRPKTQIKIVAALGLKKTNSSVIKNSEDTILGMLKKVNHLVCIENVE